VLGKLILRGEPRKAGRHTWLVPGLVAALAVLVMANATAVAGPRPLPLHRTRAPGAQAQAKNGRSPNGSPHRANGHDGPGDLPASPAPTPTGRDFGPLSGLHVRVEGTASTGYRAVIYDGKTFVTGRGLVGPWDVTVVPEAEGTRAPLCRLARPPTCSPARLHNRYTKLTYSPATRTLRLSGAVNVVDGTTVSRFETYRFVGQETVASTVGVRSGRPALAWYSPYTDFPPNWEPMWAGGYARYYNSPSNDDNAQDSPIPVLGESNGRYVYGMASGATWDYPVPGYNTPHLLINYDRLAAPKMGTQANPLQLRPGVAQQWETVFFRSRP
jgi:hypothetical protein